MLLNKCTLHNEKTGLRISGQQVSGQDIQQLEVFNLHHWTFHTECVQMDFLERILHWFLFHCMPGQITGDIL